MGLDCGSFSPIKALLRSSETSTNVLDIMVCNVMLVADLDRDRRSGLADSGGTSSLPLLPPRAFLLEHDRIEFNTANGLPFTDPA